MEVFCAMQYDLNGQCVPSRFFDNDSSGLGGWTQHIYPLRGQRPQNLWEELYLRAQLKVKVFALEKEEYPFSTLTEIPAVFFHELFFLQDFFSLHNIEKSRAKFLVFSYICIKTYILY